MILKSVFYAATLLLVGAVNAAQYCDPVTSVCYSETKAGDLYVRVAIPMVDQGPFDLLLQLVAPKRTAGWAAIAWGGKMTKNPITVAWANGNKTVVSSRWAEYVHFYLSFCSCLEILLKFFSRNYYYLRSL
ncbi:hypothetical protein RRF57_002741 [Xylaria bambusicola]|uniref:Cellobiose dehydrogenase-like cytochrome domain-containing protein n=1 Tax=Xylaria bambusicola TaxID=326684 RepID=A0AAN7UKQ8_9PEZI